MGNPEAAQSYLQDVTVPDWTTNHKKGLIRICCLEWADWTTTCCLSHSLTDNSAELSCTCCTILPLPRLAKDAETH